MKRKTVKCRKCRDTGAQVVLGFVCPCDCAAGKRIQRRVKRQLDKIRAEITAKGNVTP